MLDTTETVVVVKTGLLVDKQTQGQVIQEGQVDSQTEEMVDSLEIPTSQGAEG